MHGSTSELEGCCSRKSLQLPTVRLPRREKRRSVQMEDSSYRVGKGMGEEPLSHSRVLGERVIGGGGEKIDSSKDKIGKRPGSWRYLNPERRKGEPYP